LGNGWRVRPLDDLQWVLERRAKPERGRLKSDGERWLAWAYCRTRVGLETALPRLRAEGIVLDPARLAALPEFFDAPPQNEDPAGDLNIGGVISPPPRITKGESYESGQYPRPRRATQ
jgi:hypothetical protein